MAPFELRLQRAKTVANHSRIKASDMEARLGTRYTADTLRRLKQRFPRHAFVWIIGADNLAQIARWNRWTRIFHAVPVAVFDRPTYSYRALASTAAHRFRRRRLRPGRARSLAESTPPAWVFIPAVRHPASATELRARLARMLKTRPPSPSSTLSTLSTAATEGE
jgi:nicotinate-nucleotide adenylyltransferase